MLLAYTLVAALLTVVGVAMVKPPAREVSETGVGDAGIRAGHSARRSQPVSLTVTTAGLYRGRSASEWAGRFRRRTRQLQQARRAVRHALQFPVYGLDPLERAFMCIHGFEGSWTDSGAPFYGGLQMDLEFQQTYGDWALRAFGTADHWPVSVQLAVAIRAKVSGRGFYPWPNTARACGLI